MSRREEAQEVEEEEEEEEYETIAVWGRAHLGFPPTRRAFRTPSRAMVSRVVAGPCFQLARAIRHCAPA